MAKEAAKNCQRGFIETSQRLILLWQMRLNIWQFLSFLGAAVTPYTVFWMKEQCVRLSRFWIFISMSLPQQLYNACKTCKSIFSCSRLAFFVPLAGRTCDFWASRKSRLLFIYYRSPFHEWNTQNNVWLGNFTPILLAYNKAVANYPVAIHVV